jgi:hypothetical protein
LDIQASAYQTQESVADGKALPVADADTRPWWRQLFGVPASPMETPMLIFTALRFLALAALMAAPALLMEPAEIKRMWFLPIMGVCGVLGPATGMPVAGGIVFFPALALAGLSPRDSVSLGVAIQTVGIGVLTPLSWLLTDPAVFLWPVLRCALPPAVAGLLVALYVIPVSDAGTLLCFTAFCTFTLCYTVLTWNGLMTQAEPLRLSACRVAEMAVAGFIGGILVGVIGIGIEKGAAPAHHNHSRT